MVKQPAAVQARAPGQRSGPTDVPHPAPSLPAGLVARMLDVAPDGLLLVDGEGRVALVNRRVEELFGYHRAELVGQPVELLLPEALRAAHVTHRRQYADQPWVRPMAAGPLLRGRHRDGSEVPLEVSLTPLEIEQVPWTVAAVRGVGTRAAAEVADAVVRGLFGVGLQLHGLVRVTDGSVRDGLWRVLQDIDATIRSVSSAVFPPQRPAADP